jgi:hypothetical protein
VVAQSIASGVTRSLVVRLSTADMLAPNGLPPTSVNPTPQPYQVALSFPGL